MTGIKKPPSFGAKWFLWQLKGWRVTVDLGHLCFVDTIMSKTIASPKETAE